MFTFGGDYSKNFFNFHDLLLNHLHCFLFHNKFLILLFLLFHVLLHYLFRSILLFTAKFHFPFFFQFFNLLNILKNLF